MFFTWLQSRRKERITQDDPPLKIYREESAVIYLNLLHSTESKPNFVLSFCLLRLVWVCTKFPTFCKDTKMASPQLIFKGHQSQVVENLSGTVENERSPVNRWAFLPLTCIFRQNQNNNESNTNPIQSGQTANDSSC